MLKLTLNTFKERLAGEKDGGLAEIASFGDISGAVKKKINGCNCFESNCDGHERVMKWSIFTTTRFNCTYNYNNCCQCNFELALR